jgi:ABC-type sugar transport system ATPase subunit
MASSESAPVPDSVPTEPASPPILAARGIVKSYGGVHALSGVTLEFPAGSVTAIVGDNGAGKSSLIKILAGAMQPDEGQLEVDGQPVRFATPAQARAAGIETVYQDLALADHRDVTENLFMGRELTRGWGPIRFTDGRQMRRQTEKALQDLNVKIPSVRQQVRKLSGGQRQGVAIGRAVHWGSRVLIMDEPMAALGLQEAGRVQELVLRLSERGLTQIVVSHNLEHVFTLATRIVVMRLGRVVGVRPTAESNHEEIVRMVAGLADRSVGMAAGAAAEARAAGSTDSVPGAGTPG